MTHTKGMCVDLSPGVGQSTDLISLVSCNPIRLVKDKEELQVHLKPLTPSQMEAFQLMTNSSQQRLLIVTGPGGTGKSFLIHTVVGYLTLYQGKFVEVLASSGSAAYLLGGKTVHRFFRLGLNLECFLEWGTVDGSMVSNADVLIIDECSIVIPNIHPLVMLHQIGVLLIWIPPYTQDSPSRPWVSERVWRIKCDLSNRSFKKHCCLPTSDEILDMD